MIMVTLTEEHNKNYYWWQWRLQEFFSRCSWVGLPCNNFSFFKFFVTIFSFLDFSSFFFFFSFFFLLESNVMNTVMNTVLDLILVCFVERNILVPIYFDVPFQGVSGFLKKIKNNIYLYFLIQHYKDQFWLGP